MTHRLYLAPQQDREVNEGSACSFVARTQSAGAAITPTSMRYRIDCLSTGDTVLDWTSIAVPDTENTITVTAAQNAIINACSRRETKQLVVESVYGGETRNDSIEWVLKNLRGVS